MAALVMLNLEGGEGGGGEEHSMKSYKERLYPKVQPLILT